jgi:phage repressor protein C with HTH and peptisase S24 domain
MKTLQEIVTARLDEIGRGPGTAERIGGLGKNYVSDIVRGEKRDVRSSYLPRLAKALDWTAEELRAQIAGTQPTHVAMMEIDATAIERLPLDIPVLGVAAASVAGAFVVDGEIDRVRRPPGLTHAKNVYALYVRGDSMSPRYRPGELIFVSPDRPAGAGDDVVVQTRNHPGAPLESWLKEYVRSDGSTVHTRQLNPPGAVDFRADQVVAVHRVLTMREMFGA